MATKYRVNTSAIVSSKTKAKAIKTSVEKNGDTGKTAVECIEVEAHTWTDGTESYKKGDLVDLDA